MAIQINYTDPDTGVNLPAAYARIETLIFQQGGSSGCSVAVYVDATAKANRQPYTITSYSFPNAIKQLVFALQNPPVLCDPRAQAYLYLKTLPDFSGGLDV